MVSGLIGAVVLQSRAKSTVQGDVLVCSTATTTGWWSGSQTSGVVCISRQRCWLAFVIIGEHDADTMRTVILRVMPARLRQVAAALTIKSIVVTWAV